MTNLISNALTASGRRAAEATMPLLLRVLRWLDQRNRRVIHAGGAITIISIGVISHSTGPQASSLIVIFNHVSLGGRLPAIGDYHDPEILALQARILDRSDQLGTSAHAALLDVALGSSGASSVLTGTRSIDHLLENAKAVHRT